ncbi:MAG: M3 family oligoendopeptidase [Armatimonadota bacterium]|nr:M3 family oligoendopeptidase [Armatimonadota bacterium]
MTVAADLSAQFPRRFVPPDADLGDWGQIEPLLQRLLQTTPDSPEALVRWLEDVSELLAAVDEVRARRYVAYTVQTNDPARERAYLAFIEEIQPRLKPLVHALDVAYLTNPHRGALPPRFAVLDRRIANRVALFRPENVPLETDEARLKQQYQKITGAMTVTYQGREHTLQQMARYLEEPDRSTRQEAWELVARRRLQDRGALDEVFDRLLALREQIARNAGYPDYRAYAFRLRERFDYTPEDCLRFHDAVEEVVVPLVRRLHGQRRQALGVETLRPWDLDVDPHGRSPLRPFQHVEELLDGTEAIFCRVDPDLARQFRFLREQGLLDLESRVGKAPGGYQAEFAEQRVPFIFMNAVGVEADVRTLLHEGGHAFHFLASRAEPLLDLREPPIEFAEVASMGMELLATPHLDVFYRDPPAAARARRQQYERVLLLFPWVATVDAFQHWLYTHPGHAREAREAAWVALYRRFHPDVDFSGYEEALATAWHRQLHIFLYPFYYIEYAIAEMGALSVWLQARADPDGAVRRYRAALALAGTRPLPELFAAAGARFELSAEGLRPLAAALADDVGL